MSTNNPVIDPILFPRGIADPEGRAGYVWHLREGIDAIDLANGALLWRTSVASRPLLVVNNTLIAQARVKGMPNALQVVVLDRTQSGRLLLTSEPVVFPVRISIFSAAEEEFRLQPRVDGDDLLLIWEAHTRYRGGAPPSPRAVQQATTDTAGLVRVNMGTGAVAMLPLPPAMRSPDLTALSTALPIESAPYQLGATFHNEPWRVDERLAAVIIEPTEQKLTEKKSTEKKPALVLQHWSVSENPTLLQSTKLLEGAAFIVALSLNRQYLFVHRDPLPKRDANWHVFSAQSGQAVAKTPHDAETQEIQVLNEQMFYTVATPQGRDRATLQIEVRARTLATGELLWRYVIDLQESAPPKLRG